MKITPVEGSVCCLFTESVSLIERFQRSGNFKVGPFSFLEFEVESAMAQTRETTDQVRAHEALVIQWRYHGLLPAPRFRGMITVRPNGPATLIRIDGHYIPPLGVLGGVLDALVGRFVAHRTVKRLLARLTAFIDGEQKQKHVAL